MIEVEDTAEMVLEHANGARTVFYATVANTVNAPVTLDITTERATLSLRGDLTVTHADGRVEVVPERKAASGGRAYWGVSHELLIRDFYDRLGDPEPFWISPRRRPSRWRSSKTCTRSRFQPDRPLHCARPARVRHVGAGTDDPSPKKPVEPRGSWGGKLPPQAARLLERDAELAALGSYWAEALTGRGRFVFLGGEGGAGKTSLGLEFGQTGRRPRQVPGRRLRRRRDTPGAGSAGRRGRRARRVGRAGRPRGASGVAVPRVRAALGRTPTLLLLEDVQWADEATLDLVRYLGAADGRPAAAGGRDLPR